MPRIEQKRFPSREILWLDDKTAASDLSGKTYIVTGANSGVGLETTRHLVKQGAHVVMACRRTDAGEEVAKSFGASKGSYKVMKLDLADLQSVRDFVSTFLDKYDRLDGIACNAGMVNMGGNEPAYTKDGIELTIGISYFGHFLLTELLLDILKKSAPARVVILSSVVHAGNPNNRPDVNLSDINFKNRDYSPFGAYAEAKVATNLYAMELGKRLKDAGVSAFSVHPGWARSNFGSGARFPMNILMSVMRPLTRTMSDSSEESAQTSLHCLLSDEALNHSGAYFSQSSVLYRDPGTRNGGWPMESPNPNATNMDTAKKLIDLSYKMVGMKEG